MVVRQLSVFRGGFTREAAESVAGATLAQLSACVDKSLLWRTGAGRYEMHELLRQYAQSKLSQAGEAEAVCRRHRDYCRALLSSESNFVWGAVDVAMLRRVEAEQGNLSAALAWSKAHDEPQAHLSLVVAMTWFWFVRADYAEGRKWLEAALQAGPDAAPEARPRRPASPALWLSSRATIRRPRRCCRPLWRCPTNRGSPSTCGPCCTWGGWPCFRASSNAPSTCTPRPWSYIAEAAFSSAPPTG
jgi:hypothetical protein